MRPVVASTSRTVAIRAFSTSPCTLKPREALYNPWKGKAHVRKPPTIPAPTVRLFPQRIVTTDGSTFTAYTTAPSPAHVVLTRDVNNNPIWAPGTEKRQDETVDGQVGKFRKRFGAADGTGAGAGDGTGAGDTGAGAAAAAAASFGQADLDWMSVGAKEVKPPTGGSKKKAVKRK